MTHYVFRVPTPGGDYLVFDKEPIIQERYALVTPHGAPINPTPKTTAPLRAATHDAPELRSCDIATLGSGGFGTVVRARTVSFGLDRAIKFVCRDEQSDPDAFRREVQATGTTPFKHVLPLLDYGE